MSINNLDLFPKTTRSTETDAERISDNAYYVALHTGIYASLFAVENYSNAKCGGGDLLAKCDTVRDAVRSTMQLIPADKNEDFTGWVGYERTTTDCNDCTKSCTVSTYWEDGTITEKMRYIFLEKLESEVVINI